MDHVNQHHGSDHDAGQHRCRAPRRRLRPTGRGGGSRGRGCRPGGGQIGHKLPEFTPGPRGQRPPGPLVEFPGRQLAAGSLNGRLRLWDFSDRAHPRLLSPIPTSGTAAIYAVAFSRDGLTLAGGSNDGTIRLWDVADPARPRPLAILPGGTAAIDSVAFSRDGRAMASGSDDGTIRLRDVTDPAQPR